MGEIILSQVGASVGASLLPNGIGVLGQTISGAAIGQTIGSLAGRAIDASMLSPKQGPRLKSLQIMESREGVGLPRVYGRMRVGGQVIWAARFKEKRNEQSSGKGGPKYVNYTYSVSFAVALCQGPITRVDRVWANGELFDLSTYNWRLYLGDETQMPDPLIEAIEGSGHAPAYRGTAYIVFEDLPLDAFGSRLPQLSFEVVRSGDILKNSLAQTVEGVNIIPASGEFVYATTPVKTRRFPGIETPINQNNIQGRADFSVSLEQLQTDLPKVKAAALTVGWFGDDLRAGECKIRPGIEQPDRSTVPFPWTVDGVERDDAYLISRTNDSPNYGGTPADQSVIEGIRALNAAGIAVTLSPFLFMDIPPGNGLSDPYGAAEQAAFPWRGRINVSRDKSASARSEIDGFVGLDGDFGFRHFILHHARLARQAGGVEAILIGSEMVEMTRARDQNGRYPFAEALQSIAQEVRAIVGPAVKISYAADWTEYGAYAPSDSSGDVLFPLDDLWAEEAIDFIGVDWYPPASDWREGDDHLDAVAGFSSLEDAEYIEANMEGGEAFDWYYASKADRDAQRRTQIRDTAHNEHWVFRAKDLQAWWESEHFPRPSGVRSDTATAWQPESKPIRMIEIGFPAVDKGTNAPNLFYDPKSSESAFPVYSNGLRDDLLQRRALSVAVPYWQSKSAIEQVLVWAWDGRPWPDFPARRDIWSDGPNWQYGHWLNGRSGLMELSEVLEDLAVQADVALDARGVNGVVDGYIVDGVTSLASAISPLVEAFNFDPREEQTRLVAADQIVQVQADLTSSDFIQDSRSETIPLLDKQPSGVSLSYISGDFSYQPAIASIRYPGADRSFVVQSSIPLVLNDARARMIADQQYQKLHLANTLALSLPPETGLALDIADLVAIEDTPWRIERVETRGLETRFLMRDASQTFVPQRAVNAPDVLEPISIAAEPDFVIIDGPELALNETSGALFAVSATPWPGVIPIQLGVSETALISTVVASQPAGLGEINAALTSGPLGRWDKSACIELDISGEELVSAETSAVLSGTNRLLLQNDAGWELIAWKEAELVSENRWRLKQLLRGLSGTPIRAAGAHALAVRADDRLVRVPLGEQEFGIPLIWKVGGGDGVEFTYQDRASLPWRVGHLKHASSDGGLTLSWTPRDADYANNWSLPDDLLEQQFRVELFNQDLLVSSFEQPEASLTIPIGTADTARVAPIGLHRRLGEWVSIPLPPP
ncbi:MAG: glycoside hydrolase/phage tail family protein [Pseudomonadota bacterium]